LEYFGIWGGIEHVLMACARLYAARSRGGSGEVLMQKIGNP